MIENNGEKGFVIKDRRLFDEEGKVRGGGTKGGTKGAHEEAQKEENHPRVGRKKRAVARSPKTEKGEKTGAGGKEQYEGFRDEFP